jgi:hypothetical protein
VRAPSAEVQARVLAQVVGQIGVLPPGGGGSGGGGAARLVAGHPLASVLGTFALGVIVGVGGMAVRERPWRAAPVVYIDRTSPVASPVAPTAKQDVMPTNAGWTPAPAPMPVLPARAAAPASTPRSTIDASQSGRDLAAEQALLDVARAALSRGDAQGAIEAAQRHAEEYPKGQLVEEREAILIRALVQVGAAEEARTRALRFHARFPDSIFGRTIDAAIASIP